MEPTTGEIIWGMIFYLIVPVLVVISCRGHIKHAINRFERRHRRQDEELSAIQKEMRKELYISQQRALNCEKELFERLNKIQEGLWKR